MTYVERDLNVLREIIERGHIAKTAAACSECGETYVWTGWAENDNGPMQCPIAVCGHIQTFEQGRRALQRRFCFTY